MSVAATAEAGSRVIADTSVKRTRVAIRTSDETGPVGNAYVALVPVHLPSSRPLVEAIAQESVSWFDIPAGEYFAIAGAPGKGIATRGPIQIRAETRNDIEMLLPGVRTVTGTVHDDRGKAISGAIVADVNAAVEAPLGRVSSLARNHLAASWRATSHSDGTWTIMLPADARTPIVVQAAGYGSGWSKSIQELSAEHRFVLSAGARLRVRLSRTDPEFIVTLQAVENASAVPDEWQAQYWAKQATKPILEWESLALGSYDVYVQQSDLRSFSKPIKIASVLLEPGTAPEISVELPAATPAPSSIAELLVRRFARKAFDSMEFFGRGKAGAPQRIPHVLEEAIGGTVILLDTTEVQPPYYAQTLDKLIVPSSPVNEESAIDSAIVLQRADAGLHIRSADSTLPLPGGGTAIFHGCGSLAPVSLPVAVRKDGTVLFVGPSDCNGLSLTFEPFSPLILARALSGSAGQAEWLGEFTLYAAGAAGVRVVSDAGQPIADVSVTISAGSMNSKAVSVASARTNADGWAHFDGLPSGREMFAAATTPDGDRSLPHAFSVEPGMQVVVDPLVVPRPATLAVKPTLGAEVIRAFPSSRIELLVLDREDSPSRTEQYRQKLSDKGNARFERVEPGYWRLTALIATGTSMQPVRGEVVELKPGVLTEVTPSFEPDVFRGRVTVRGEGVKGNIDIIGTERSDVVPSIGTSATGHFTALLPRRGSYQVAVRTRDPYAISWVGDVEFSNPEQLIEIALPEYEIVVSVRSAGKAIGHVSVRGRMLREGVAGMQSLHVEGTTDSSGEARLQRLLPGVWIVSAVTEDGARYAEKRVTVSDAKPLRLTLDLAAASSIRGTVRQAFGAPVAGARVNCILPADEGPAQAFDTWSTDDGTFEIDGNVGFSTALCGVTSFFGADSYRVSGGARVTLTLPSNPAELLVLSLTSVNRLHSLWLVSRDGRPLDVSPFIQSNGASFSLRVPALAPGQWRLVRVSSLADWIALGSGAGTLLPTITEVNLGAGETKVIDLRITQ